MKKRLLLLSSMGLALCVSNCGSKKTPASAASGTDGNAAASSNTGTGLATGDASSSNSDSSAGSNLSGLPIVYFDYDQSSINDQGRSTLQKIAPQLKSKKTKVTVEGHCDERGSNEYNLALGERRSQAVKSYLQKLGIGSDRISAISYGEERPAVTGSSESTWSKNRRAELVVAQ